MNISTPAKQFNYDRAMLWGERLKILLNTDFISYGEISRILKNKGIFFNSIAKSDLVPLLSSCLLTPKEFMDLIERSFIRELGEKYSSCKFELASNGVEWKNEIRENFDDVVSGIKPEHGREFASEPSVKVEKSGDIVISYSLRVVDFSKDWIEQEIIYPSEIIINQSEDKNKLEIKEIKTSKDTGKINDKIIGALGRFYLSKNIIKNEKPTSIVFDNFDNIQRIRFFLQLTNAKNDEFSFVGIDTFDIVRDQKAGKLPEEQRIKWMEGHVNSLQIKGTDLGKTFLLKEETYYQYYFLIKMITTYEFKFGANIGKCNIEFAFSGKSSRSDDFSNTTFDFSIKRISPSSEEGSKRKVKKTIVNQIQGIIDSALKNISLNS
ncbi:GapS4b family protein [Snodgrassella communis]|uniref:GapS4b family protein n=2 Tax=Snodgrassella communis TaxID=2946699 RepID=UPI001EF457D3|nr:hypothetical protein [Snodgrassella communis]